MKKVINFLLISITFALSIQQCFGINLVSTPLKYELKVSPGDIITKTAKLTSREQSVLFITTGKSNVIADSITGNPVLVDAGDPNQELASWITIDTNSFNIDPLGTYTINFEIHVPTDATPGGHYGVVLFRYDPTLNNSNTSSINIKAEYGVLILLEVDGEIIDDGNAGNVVITPGGGGGGGGGYFYRPENPPENKIDECPFGDFSASNTDGKCFDEITLDKIVDYIKQNDDLELNSADDEEFEIDFSVPFQNDGNTHIKPTGKVTLVDEDGDVLEKVGVESIIENGVVVGEEIVDYIPINQEGQNVLPNTEKIFEQKWRGFFYYSLDENWNKVIKYLAPSDYYSSEQQDIIRAIYPWQKVYTLLKQRKIKVVTELSYTNHDGELVEFNSAEEIYVEYEIKRVGYNLYFFLALAFFILLFWLILFIMKIATKKKCIKCKKYIRKKLEICPYCGAKQVEKNKKTRKKSG